MQQNDNLCFHKQSSLIDVKSEVGCLLRSEPQDIVAVYGQGKGSGLAYPSQGYYNTVFHFSKRVVTGFFCNYTETMVKSLGRLDNL